MKNPSSSLVAAAAAAAAGGGCGVQYCTLQVHTSTADFVSYS